MPDAPKQPTVLEVYHDSALISWEPPADGGKPITGYIVERKETMANRYVTTQLWTRQLELNPSQILFDVVLSFKTFGKHLQSLQLNIYIHEIGLKQ